MKLTKDQLYAALLLVSHKVEKAGASPELTDIVTLVGDIRSAVGNKWNPANPHSAARVKDLLQKK